MLMYRVHVPADVDVGLMCRVSVTADGVDVQGICHCWWGWCAGYLSLLMGLMCRVSVTADVDVQGMCPCWCWCGVDVQGICHCWWGWCAGYLSLLMGLMVMWGWCAGYLSLLMVMWGWCAGYLSLPMVMWGWCAGYLSLVMWAWCAGYLSLLMVMWGWCAGYLSLPVDACGLPDGSQVGGCRTGGRAHCPQDLPQWVCGLWETVRVHPEQSHLLNRGTHFVGEHTSLFPPLMCGML